MENNSESLSLDKNIHYEIPLSSCSNLHLFKQLQIFLQQNNIPIEITTSISHNQTGGGQETKSKSITYQSEYSPYSIFKGFMDKYVLQKQHENTEDTKNKQLLDSIFSKDKSKKEMIQSLQTLSKNTSREKEKESESEPSNIESVIKEEPSKKKKLSTSSINQETTKTLYMQIKTNNHNPIDSIKGTKLYYLYQRQQNAQCAQFV
jgi:uncharacterized membrane-anchored protein YjiN (DUF445 family)